MLLVNVIRLDRKLDIHFKLDNKSESISGAEGLSEEWDPQKALLCFTPGKRSITDYTLSNDNFYRIVQP